MPRTLRKPGEMRAIRQVAPGEGLRLILAHRLSLRETA